MTRERKAVPSKAEEAPYRLALLGGFRLVSPVGDEIEIASRKGRALMAFLATQDRRWATRETLAELLWEGHEPANAKANLRQLLSRLRRAFPASRPGPIHTARDRIGLDAELIEVDVWSFEEAVRRGAAHDLNASFDIYRGRFLAGTDVRGGMVEDWLDQCRGRFQQLACEATWRLASLAKERAQWAEVVRQAKRLLALDSLREDAHRLLMEAHVAQGRKTLALRAYRECAAVLWRELAVRPEPETVRLYNVIHTSRKNGAAPSSPARTQHRDRWPLTALAFKTIGGDPALRGFADGLVEDIATDLTRYSGLPTVATDSVPASTESLTGKWRMAQELGVRFLLEGSVRRLDERVRITARIVDTLSGKSLWAERYDRRLDDDLAAQDEITARVVSAHGQTIRSAWASELRHRLPSDLTPRERCLLAQANLGDPDRPRYEEARRLADEALAVDRDSAQGLAIAALVDLVSATCRWTDAPDALREGAYESARRAVELDWQDHFAHAVLGFCQTWHRQHDLAVESFQQAVMLNPHAADTRARFANSLVFAGHPDESLRQAEAAIRLDPRCPPHVLHFQGRAHFAARRYAAAERVFARSTTLTSGWPWAHLMLAATRAAMDNMDAARLGVAAGLRISPRLCLDDVPHSWPFRNPKDLDRLLSLLRQAGLPG